MNLLWSSAARRDLLRLHDFLEGVNPLAAARVARKLGEAVSTLPEFPERGQRIDRYSIENLRSFLVGDYEVRYEVMHDKVVIVRIFHTREDR